MHLNKLIVKIMSVLLQSVFHMIMKELISSVFYPKTVSGAFYVRI